MEKKVNNKKVLVLCLSAVFFFFLTTIIYEVIIDLNQEEILNQEIQKLLEKDIDTERFNTEIVTKGDYAIVEETIKASLDEYVVSYQKIINILDNDSRFESLLTAENYQNDGPYFIESRAYLENYQNTFNENLDIMKKYSNKDYIMQKIIDKNLDDYYVDLYEQLMFGTMAEEEWKQIADDITAASNIINTTIEYIYKIYDMLESTKDSWYISGEIIYFENQQDADNYNFLLEQMSKETV